jgi:hypothetical protein
VRGRVPHAYSRKRFASYDAAAAILEGHPEADRIVA